MLEKRTVETVSRRLAGFYRDHRRMPAYSEMIPLLGVRSKSVVHFWMRKLLREGLLEKDRKGLLRPVRRDFALPLVGAIQAGFPTPSEEELRDLVSIDEYLVTKPEASFLLRVSGDSMTGEGIMPGAQAGRRGRGPGGRRVDDEILHAHERRRRRAGVGQPQVSPHPRTGGTEDCGNCDGRGSKIPPVGW